MSGWNPISGLGLIWQQAGFESIALGNNPVLLTQVIDFFKNTLNSNLKRSIRENGSPRGFANDKACL